MGQFLEYCKADLIDPALISFVAVSHRPELTGAFADRQDEPEAPSTEPYVRRYQIEFSESSTRIDVKLDTPEVEAGASPVEAVLIPASGNTPMVINSVSEGPKQESTKLAEDSNGTIKPTEEEDLFGDNTVAEPVSAMSPPRY